MGRLGFRRNGGARLGGHGASLKTIPGLVGDRQSYAPLLFCDSSGPEGRGVLTPNAALTSLPWNPPGQSVETDPFRDHEKAPVRVTLGAAMPEIVDTLTGKLGRAGDKLLPRSMFSCLKLS